MSDGDSFARLLADAEDCLTNLDDCLGGVEDLDELDADTLEGVQSDLDTLTRVATETGELLEALDLTDLPEAVDADELFEAIDAGEIPDALADEDTGVGDVVEFTQVFRAIDLLEAWDATDLTDIWAEKRELDDAIEAAADEGEDASAVEKAAATVADDDESLLGDEDGDLIGDDDEDLIETDVDPVEGTKEALGKPDVAEDPEAYQVFIQKQAMKGLDAFREALLETNAKFERLYEINREKMRRQDTSTNSRNPTAASTIQTDRRDLGGGARHATVPQQVKLSTAPSRKRIYGRRFEIERQKRRTDNDD
ncbi:hypothetical protein ACFO5R_06465 [Halosolutus amylolyticus]|uniref:Uncharacterized protein n=1 Tax=Halosolutus amylolyticus TaxID=2932267 RepID=A0ABD5PLU3_9EURY|nr:hypothetical protein [Halosolutus amylolyticus]